MRRFSLISGLTFSTLVCLFAAGPRVHADEIYTTSSRCSAGAVVKVNFALNVQVSRRGQSQDGEVSGPPPAWSWMPSVSWPSRVRALQPRSRFPGRSRRPGRGAPSGMEMKARHQPPCCVRGRHQGIRRGARRHGQPDGLPTCVSATSKGKRFRPRTSAGGAGLRGGRQGVLRLPPRTGFAYDRSWPSYASPLT